MGVRELTFALALTIITAPVVSELFWTFNKINNTLYTTLRPSVGGEFGQAMDQTHQSAQLSLWLLELFSNLEPLILLIGIVVGIVALVNRR